MKFQIAKCKTGSLRADVNVSVRKKGEKEYGTRTEMKGMSSFRSIVRAIDFEAQRQINIIENGGKIYQTTLRWDEISGETSPMRDKENAKDYRYFPEPDLLPIRLSKEYIENVKNNLPELPESRRKRYIEEYKLSSKDANKITASKYLSDLFEKTTKLCNNAKAVANWILSDISRILNEKELEPNQIPFTEEHFASVIKLIDKGLISTTIAKKVICELFENPRNPEDIVKENGWLQISDENEIKNVVLKVLNENPQSVVDYKGGKDRALGYLVGQAMKETKGNANPGILNKMFKEELSK